VGGSIRETQTSEKHFYFVRIQLQKKFSTDQEGSQVAHQRFLCALKAHFEYQNVLLVRIKSAGVLPGLAGEEPGAEVGFRNFCQKNRS